MSDEEIVVPLRKLKFPFCPIKGCGRPIRGDVGDHLIWVHHWSYDQLRKWLEGSS